MNGNTAAEWVTGLGLWPLIVLLVPNIMFRRYGKASGKKRMASLLQAVAVFLITGIAMAVMQYKGTDVHFFAGIGVIAIIAVLLRKRMFPYRLTCPSCDTRLDFKTIYFRDDHLCEKCRPVEKEVIIPDAGAEEEEDDGSHDYPELDDADDDAENDNAGR